MEDLELDFINECPHQFYSVVEFNSTSGDFNATFFYEDVNFLKGTRFTDSDGNVAMKWRIVAIMPGSTIHGPAANKDELIFAEFKIVIIDDTDVQSCLNNELIKFDTDIYDEFRADEFTYQINTVDAEADVLRIPVLYVISTDDACGIEIVAEYLEPETQEWHVIRNTDKSALYYDTTGTLEYMDVAFRQDYYLEDLAHTFKDATVAAGSIPD
jgi:hypothetical protein